MDLSSAKVTPEQKVSLCTKYFYLGFLCLPFLWGVNAAWFFGEAFRSKTDQKKQIFKGKISLSAPVDLRSKQNVNRKPEFEGQKKIKKLVIWSFAGFLVWSIALVTWIAVFTTNRCFSYQKYFSIELCIAHSGLLGEQLPTT